MKLALDIPVLETERLILRAPREADLEKTAAFMASERAQFVGGPQTTYQVHRGILAALGHWALHGYGFWSLEEKDTGAYVGRVGLLNAWKWPEPEIGWSLMDGSEGKGYATEAARAARDHAYGTLGWTTAISLIDPANTGSQNVARRLGASFEAPYEHPEFGTMYIWRHPGPEELT